MITKTDVYEACQEVIKQRISFLKNLLEELQQGTLNDAKSSAGDKHETAISNMQLEQEKLNKQLASAKEQYSQLAKISPQLVNGQMSAGALAQTNHGWIYISVSLGKIIVGDTEVFCVSHTAPIALALKGKKVGESATVLNKLYQVEALF
jgi:hypothetical protein